MPLGMYNICGVTCVTSVPVPSADVVTDIIGSHTCYHMFSHRVGEIYLITVPSDVRKSLCAYMLETK